MSFPRYPTYKDSGVEWLGEVPKHWEVGQSRRRFVLRNERALDGEEQLTASQKHGIISQADFVESEGRRVVEVIKGADILKHVEEGDFVISMRSFQGGIEYSPYCGSISSAYVMLKPVKDVHPRFFRWLFKSDRYIQALQSTSNLVRDGQALRYSNFAQVDIPVVPLSEQASIASFLDHETAKIDALIAEQQRLIELLQEKRQAVISHAVIKGLNPDAPMKDSGVEWLGEVPAHWSVSAVGHRYEVRLGKMLDEKRVTGEYLGPYLRNTDVQWESINFEELPEMDFEPSEHDRYSLREGDLLVCEGGEVGRSAIWQSQLSFCFYQKALHRLRPHNQISDNSRFQLYVMRMACSMGVFEASAGKATINHLPAESFRRYRFAYPPLDEQIAICEHLSQVCSQMNELEAEAQSLVSTLQERRSALISAAVTGQIDVRGLVPEASAV